MSRLIAYRPHVKVIRHTSTPAEMISAIARQTQVLDSELKQSNKPEALIEYLFKANHTSVFEHASITVQITRISRALLAQITRHRMASFTSSSQHYADHGSADFYCAPMAVPNEKLDVMVGRIFAFYEELQEVDGLPREEARMILPNGCEVNLVMTINARSLINLLNQRLCRRNTREMLEVAHELLRVASEWFPELFSLVGPDCEQLHYKCTQGKMACRASR